MARLQEVKQHRRPVSACVRFQSDEGPSSSSTGYTSKNRVVESSEDGYTQGGQYTSGSGTASTSKNDTTAREFEQQSKGMEERAKRDLKETLVWVTRLGEGAVDRRLLREAARVMRPNAYKDVLTERWVNHACAYPACGNEPRREYEVKPVYRINLRAKRVFDTSAAVKFCSDECARRSAWYEAVCLQANAFEVLSPDRTIQLLEDVQDEQAQPPSSATTPSASTSSAHAVHPAPASALSERAVLPPIQVVQDEYSQLADNFLARLSIVERNPTEPPAPPALDKPSASEDRPSLSSPSTQLRNAGSALLPFDMGSVSREIVGAQGTGRPPPSSRLKDRSGEEEDEQEAEAAPVRRVEVDVDPEYKEYMDVGWQLFKELREAGEVEP